MVWKSDLFILSNWAWSRDKNGEDTETVQADTVTYKTIGAASWYRTSRWYVTQVSLDHESAMTEMLARVLPKGTLAELVFQPYFAIGVRACNTWQLVEHNLPSGYSVAVSSDSEPPEKFMDSVVEFCRALGMDSVPALLSPWKLSSWAILAAQAAGTFLCSMNTSPPDEFSVLRRLTPRA